MCEPSTEVPQDGGQESKWKDFFSNPKLKKACENYAKPVEELAFNPFVLMSDTYHRENFHSDILKAILSPNGTHGEGTRFLNLFYDLLIGAARWKGKNDKVVTVSVENIDFESEAVISNIQAIKACNKVTVTREVGNKEYGRTDIAICGRLPEDSSSLKALSLEEDPPKKDWVIIIENKINGASDQPRQLPRYVDEWTDGEICGVKRYVVAIVYIVPSDENATPSTNGWNLGGKTGDDDKKVFPKLITLPAYNENVSFSLFNFLRKCELEAKKFNSVALFRQYAALMKEQAGGNMCMKEKEIETVFSQAESNDVSLKVLQSMLENVPDNRSKTLNMELIKTMRAASLIGNKEKKWTEPDITNYAVYINGPTFQMDNKTVCLAIDIPFYDLDALGVVTVFVRDANGAPVERGLDNLPDEVKDKLKEPHGLFPSEREGWKDMRYDDRGKWRGKEGKTYYPSDEDLEEIAKQITKLIIALNDCPQYLALFKPKASAEAADKA